MILVSDPSTRQSKHSGEVSGSSSDKQRCVSGLILLPYKKTTRRVVSCLVGMEGLSASLSVCLRFAQRKLSAALPGR